MATSTIENLPAEIGPMIATHLDSQSFLAVKLTSRKLNSFSLVVLQQFIQERIVRDGSTHVKSGRTYRQILGLDPPGQILELDTPAQIRLRRLRELMKAHMQLEKHEASQRCRRILFCFTCGQYKPRAAYTDAGLKLNKQGRNNSEFYRKCIPCGVRAREFKDECVVYRGIERIICMSCSMPKPFAERYDGRKNLFLIRGLFPGIDAKHKWCKNCAKEINDKRPGCFLRSRRH